MKGSKRQDIKYLKKNSFKNKIIKSILLTVVGISLLIIVLANISSNKTIISKAKELASKQGESIKTAINQEMASIYQLGSIMCKNEIIRKDLANSKGEFENYQVFANEVYMNLLNYKKLNSNINYIAELKFQDASIKYIGKQWYADKEVIYNSFMQDYEEAEIINENELKISAGQNGFMDGENVVKIYFPIYDSVKVYKKIGVVCIGIAEKTLYEYCSNTFFSDVILVNQQNEIVSSINKEKIGKRYKMSDFMKENQEATYVQGEYLIYDYIPECKWYLVAKIPLLVLLNDSIKTFLVSVLLMLVCCGIAVFICYRVTQSLYHPLEDLQQRMETVANGDLSIRMDVEYQEDEFNRMARSFNKMVNDVNNLMNRVKEEQEQMKKIELSALQSQIKPHFLYNALECIHMQSVIDGNKENARMVKALANYYRLCLGKGQDLVPLNQELQHIENYLIIQNIRYSDIVHCTINIPEQYRAIRIPKMTLQPLIENAIYHGIKVKSGGKGEVFIDIMEEGDSVILSISDTGVGMSKEQTEEINSTINIFDEQYGYGVRNVNRRLQIIFGTEYGLYYRNNKDGGTVVDIKLPYK